MKCGSWIVVDKTTGLAVIELFNHKLAMAVNRQRYDVQCAYQYLTELNKRLRP
jgi:hypothetical protein